MSWLRKLLFGSPPPARPAPPPALPLPAATNVHIKGELMAVAIRNDGMIQIICSPPEGFGTTLTFTKVTAGFVVSALVTAMKALPKDDKLVDDLTTLGVIKKATPVSDDGVTP